MRLKGAKALVSALVCLFVVPGRAMDAQTEQNVVVNGTFHRGLEGWTAQGDVEWLPGQDRIRLGPRKGSVTQRYRIGGTRIVYFGARIQGDPPTAAGFVRAKCLDARGKVVMSLEARSGLPKDPAKPEDTGLYFKTQARTAVLEVTIGREGDEPGSAFATKATLIDYDAGRKVHLPTCNLDEYMKPVWEGTTVYNESVLMLSKHGGAASGRLMFQPDRILSVRDSGLKEEFKEGVDYQVSGRTILATPGSTMPRMRDTDFPTTEFPWLSVAGKHVFVTYTHSDPWAGPRPSYVGNEMPETMARLRERKPLRVVAFGDSITLGINVTGYRGDPPYMPDWADLFGDQLHRSFGSKITLINAALGGMTSEWGKENAESAVASLKPDLVLIGFGMNDFWSIPPGTFQANIQSIIDRVRSANPKAEFVLLSSIHFDPAYTSEATYLGNFNGYVERLRSMAGNGVALLDMAGISEALYGAKKAKDLLADPMHPDDFLARWYAQGLVALFRK